MPHSTTIPFGIFYNYCHYVYNNIYSKKSIPFGNFQFYCRKVWYLLFFYYIVHSMISSCIFITIYIILYTNYVMPVFYLLQHSIYFVNIFFLCLHFIIFQEPQKSLSYPSLIPASFSDSRFYNCLLLLCMSLPEAAQQLWLSLSSEPDLPDS